jgi:hypothetical protein
MKSSFLIQGASGTKPCGTLLLTYYHKDLPVFARKIYYNGLDRRGPSAARGPDSFAPEVECPESSPPQGEGQKVDAINLRG